MSHWQDIAREFGTDKWSQGYMPIYERLLGPYSSARLHILEIGVLNGDSIRLWLKLFPHARIHGIDWEGERLMPSSMGLRVTFLRARQEDPRLRAEFSPGSLDVIIDDGSHVPAHQRDTREILWPCLKVGGLYFIEDIRTDRYPEELPRWARDEDLVSVYPMVMDVHGNPAPSANLVVLRKRGERAAVPLLSDPVPWRDSPMRVLCLGPRDSLSYVASCLWDGLQEVLGEDNVFDAVDSPYLHAGSGQRIVREHADKVHDTGALFEIGATREGRVLDEECGFDALIIHASFNRDFDWRFARTMRDRLRPGGRIAYVEDWDGAHQTYEPRIEVDACFRKEIDPSFRYPYHPPHHLPHGAPARWFHPEPYMDECRPIDIFFSGEPTACLPGKEVRWPMMGEIFRTRTRHRSLIATYGLDVPYQRYLRLLRRSKLALCPTSADLADSLRTYEAAACGAIPVFLGYPPWRRDHWFPPETCITCEVGDLAAHLDEALAHDQSAKRQALVEHARIHHTTAARARFVLEKLGLEVPAR